jgi:hypothetical protein
MSILGGFARRPNVNGLSPWVYYTGVYVKWAKTTHRALSAKIGTLSLAAFGYVKPSTVWCLLACHAPAGCVAILAAKADQSVK